MSDIFDITIIGGGPAGMMAAIVASESDKKICLFEKNKFLGQKLLLTGKGRCNFTTAKNIREIVTAFGKKGGFLYGALNRFSNQDLIDFFQKRGIKSEEERGQRVFPKNGNAKTVINCLQRDLRKNKVKVLRNAQIVKVTKQEDFFKLFTGHKKDFYTKKLIIATGGKSYPATGSTGDGYRFSKNLGHTISPVMPALVPLVVRDPDIRDLSGLSLKNVRLHLLADRQEVMNLFGEMLFTHFGVSGPIVLQMSKTAFIQIRMKKRVSLKIDLKPALSEEKLKKRLQREMEKIGKKEYQNLLATLLPKSLIPLVIKKTHIDQHRKVGSLTSNEKVKIVRFLKGFTFSVEKTMPIEQAIVTAGGVDIDEINSKTMESKIVPGLYFAGEVIGLEGPTGGFNLQKAFSTGWVAGRAAVAD